MRKECAVFVLLLVISMAYAGTVSAIAVSVTADTGTVLTVDVSGASDLYAYEVNFSVNSGTVTSSAFSGFLGGTVSHSHVVSNDYLFVYETRLDSTRTGIDGSGELFTVTYDGSLTLKGLLAIDSDGDEEYVSYNPPEGPTDDTTPSSSGSAGIPTKTEITRDLVVVPKEFSISVISGEVETESFVVFNNRESLVRLTIESEGLDDGVLTFARNSVTLSPGQEEQIDFDVFVEAGGFHVGSIVLYDSSAVLKRIPVIINVRSENFLFDAKVTVPDGSKRIKIGEKVVVDINLLQVGPELKVDVVANYIVKDFSGNILLEESETFFVLGSKTLSKELNTAGFPPGKYVVGLEIVYPGAFAVSSAQFEVLESGAFSFDTNTIIIIVVAIAIIIALIIVIWAVKKKPGRRKRRG